MKKNISNEFMWNKYYFGKTNSKNPKFYKSLNADFENAEEISSREIFECAEKYAHIFYGR